MKLVILSLSVMMLVGCNSSNKVEVPKKVDTIKKVVKKKVVKKSYPDWVDNPNIEGQEGAVGIVKLMKNKKKQEYIAKRLAIALYQEQKRVQVDTTVTTDEEVVGGSVVKSKSSQITHQTSNHFQTQTFVKRAEFSDKDNYYIWMVVKK